MVLSIGSDCVASRDLLCVHVDVEVDKIEIFYCSYDKREIHSSRLVIPSLKVLIIGNCVIYIEPKLLSSDCIAFFIEYNTASGLGPPEITNDR